jgi:hypothetical protein
MGGSQTPANNDVDLTAQNAQAAAQLAQQQQQWESEQNATNQAAAVQAGLSQQNINQTTAGTQAQAAQYQAQNQAQGGAVDATGGPAGIKAAATLQNNTDGLSPADAKLQAAGLAASPTSLASLMQKRAAGSSNIMPASGLLTSSSVRLGGS